MSDKDDTMPDDIKRDDPMVAAEYALGLLEGEELLAARGKLSSDEAFAWRKEWWDNWFAPLTDTMKGAEPGPHVWAAIAAGVDSNRAARPESDLAQSELAQSELAGGGHSAANVIDLQARLKRWQWTAGLTSAAAAVLLALMVFAPGGSPSPSPGQIDPSATGNPAMAAADPLAAQVPIGDTGLRLDVTYIPQSDQLLVGAIGLTADGVHDHELWLVPDDGGELQSLGVVTPGELRSVALSKGITDKLSEGASLVLTREPIGGKPEGQSAGPVVAEGQFAKI